MAVAVLPATGWTGVAAMEETLLNPEASVSPAAIRPTVMARWNAFIDECPWLSRFRMYPSPGGRKKSRASLPDPPILHGWNLNGVMESLNRAICFHGNYVYGGNGADRAFLRSPCPADRTTALRGRAHC